ncbi:MAG: hypothetical protein P4L53_26675 [Candidatus Obscuribacterales bacterium]|nr:hypothetical protein [Candidatus Obscuribacterales bacterium]
MQDTPTTVQLPESSPALVISGRFHSLKDRVVEIYQKHGFLNIPLRLFSR